MRRIHTIIVLVLSLSIFTGCERYRCIKGNDELISYEVEVENFTQISSDVNFDVYLEQDTVTEVVLRADENLIPYMETEVSGGQLMVTTANDRCLRSRNDIRIHIKTPDLERVILDGSGDIIIGDLVTNTMKFENHGSGDITVTDLYVENDVLIDLNGSGDIIFSTIDAIIIDAIINGSGDIDLRDGVADLGIYSISGSGSIIADLVELNESEVFLDGSGDITVWANEHLYGEISGSGRVYYRTLPRKGIHINNMTNDNVLPL